MSTKILLLGKNGQVGWELQRALAPLGHLVMHDRSSCNLSNLDNLADIIARESPNVIVNAAAFTGVDRAEIESESAYKINAEAVALLASSAAKHDALLVHYSTDYVFDGNKATPYVEADMTNPLSIYGDSKRQGELAILESGCNHFIFRTSWVFATRGANFAKTMLRLAANHESLRVVADQYGAPTSAALIADVTAHAIHRASPDNYGLYHLAARGITSWHGYAQFVIERATELGMAIKVKAVEAISIAEYPLPAKRPTNSRLDCTRLQSTFDLTLPSWQHHVEHMLVELAG